VVLPLNSEWVRQESEIREIRLFGLDDLPAPLAFEHEKMIKDYVLHR